MEVLAGSLTTVEFFAKLALSWIILVLGLVHVYRLGRQPWQESALGFLLIAASFLLFDSLDLFGPQSRGVPGTVRNIEVVLQALVILALLGFVLWAAVRFLKRTWQDYALALIGLGVALLLINNVRGLVS